VHGEVVRIDRLQPLQFLVGPLLAGGHHASPKVVWPAGGAALPRAAVTAAPRAAGPALRLRLSLRVKPVFSSITKTIGSGFSVEGYSWVQRKRPLLTTFSYWRRA